MERPLATTQLGVALLLGMLFFGSAECARAADFGPRGDVRSVRGEAQVLLALQARQDRIDPREVTVSQVVVVKNAALISWEVHHRHGLMGLIRLYDRWWDALDYLFDDANEWVPYASFPLQPECTKQQIVLSTVELEQLGLPADLVSAAAARMPEVARPAVSGRPRIVKPKPLIERAVLIDRYCSSPDDLPYVDPEGGALWLMRHVTSGYAVTLRYAKNDAPPSSNRARFTQLYVRPPTAAEILPFPTPWNFSANAVFYSSLAMGSSRPVTFHSGSTLDIWFPFVLDDTLRYNLTIAYTDPPIGPLFAKPFDNVLHYTLPAFTATPNRTLMAEIDGER